jgi:hypothetical protein
VNVDPDYSKGAKCAGLESLHSAARAVLSALKRTHASIGPNSLSIRRPPFRHSRRHPQTRQAFAAQLFDLARRDMETFGIAGEATAPFGLWPAKFKYRSTVVISTQEEVADQ